MSLVDNYPGYFEERIPPFPESSPQRPPDKLVPFSWHYVGDSWVWSLAMALSSALISVLEISLFGFLGNLVDWLGLRIPFCCIRRSSAILS